MAADDAADAPQEEPILGVAVQEMPVKREESASIAPPPESAPVSEPVSDIFGTKIEGEQLDIDSIPTEEEPSSPILQDFLADKRRAYDDEYRSALNDMFATSSPTTSDQEPRFEEAKEVLAHSSAFNYGELK